jgi:hypothetical protein
MRRANNARLNLKPLLELVPPGHSNTTIFSTSAVVQPIFCNHCGRFILQKMPSERLPGYFPPANVFASASNRVMMPAGAGNPNETPGEGGQTGVVARITKYNRFDSPRDGN